MANSANLKEQEIARQENLQDSVSKVDKFFNENKKTLWGLLIAVIVIGLAVLGFVKFIYQPKCEEAMQQLYPAEQAFQAGDFELALNGDGNILGFKDVLDEYGNKAGKAVYMYAGVSALQLGQFEDAISYLDKYKGKDLILKARALSCKGDAYVGLDNLEEAVKCYNAAAAVDENELAARYLLNAGLVYEKLGDKDAALKCYKEIQDKYINSMEAYEIEKYINRLGE